jgi:hypothetical protein
MAYYNNLIFTNHALQRLKERGATEQMAYTTFSNPDSTIDGKKPDTKEFRKKFNQSTLTLIAKQNEKKEWIILSCWIDPPLPGTKDFKDKQNYLSFQKAGFWGKLLITLKSQLGF